MTTLLNREAYIESKSGSTIKRMQNDNGVFNLWVSTNNGSTWNCEDMFSWKYHTQVTGATTINFPSGFHELIITVEIPYSGYHPILSFHLSAAQLTTAGQFYDAGMLSTNGDARIWATSSGVSLNSAVFEAIGYSSTATVKCYYR